MTVLAVDPSIQELYDKRTSIRSAALSLLTDANWPTESKTAADSLLQTMNDLPDFSTDTSVTPFKDTLVEFIHVLEGAHTRVEEASEKYGRREIGCLGAIKDKLSSRRRRRCTDTLWGCRGEIENASTKLRNCLSQISTRGKAAVSRRLTGDTDTTKGNPLTGPAQVSETPSEIQQQPIAPLLEVDHSSKPLNLPSAPQTKPIEQALASEHPTGQPTPLQGSSLGPAEGPEKRSSFRGTALTVARKTFETVEVVSGAIPGVGDYVGVAAKVGLAFVNMIETMDSNEDVSKELTSHTEELSSQLEHFQKNGKAETEEELTARIEKLRKELEGVQAKVNKWNSTGRFKKLLLSSDHADEFKANQETLLVSLKSSDILVELNRISLLDRLGDGSYGARGNSIEEVVCLPGTRVEILSRIDEWIRDTPTSENRVLWIKGMAGRGKSTIASTVAHNWSSKGSCAIFHFRRGQHVQEDRFICALARQLGKGLVPEVKKAILDCVKENEDIAKGRLEQQFKTLFVGSLSNIRKHAHPIVIVVDALDECRDVNDAVRFVRLINKHSPSLPVNVKFLLTCRPEPPLVLALELGKWRAEDLDSISDVDEDIRRVIQYACVQIRDEHDLPKSWPSSADLEAIVAMSQGLFQWARTAITYISNKSPDHRLQELLRHPSKWSGLDDLYHQILSRAFQEVEKDRERKQMLSWVLGTLVVAPYPVTLEVLAFLHADHSMCEGEGFVGFLRNDILGDLNSLLHIPKSPSEHVRLMHTSIRDLLTNRERCENRSYSVDTVQDHRRLATVTLEIMQRDLKQNICDLRGCPKNSEIQDSVNRDVPSGLRYCCRSWATHLVAGVSSCEATGDAISSALDRLKMFSDEKLLSWLEVMSLIGAVNEAYTISKQVHQWLLEWPADRSDDSRSTLWNDAKRFIAGSFELISSSALGMYGSALPQCPVETKLWLKYRGQATAWSLMNRERNWSAHIWTASTGSWVNSVAFSPDGRSVASVSGVGERGVAQIWDVETGAQLGDALAGQSKSIRSVVFSPDGKVLASGSDDEIRLWDAQTGAPLGHPLTGHSQSIRSFVFSPDSKVLASGSDDEIRLWDVQTGAPLGHPLTSHSQSIRSFVFSPDSKVLASGSCESTVQLWDAQTGASLGHRLTGHSQSIRSFVFSPDSKVLASGSDDEIRLWDVQTGAPLGHPLTSHSQSIRSFVFSPDSKVLASGSCESTVQLWDAQTGASLGHRLTGHSNSISSVVFSPDGEVLASGSYDKTVQLWNARTGAPLGRPLTGHDSGIRSVVLLPDSRVLASGADGKIRLWDAQTGAPLGNPLTGHGRSISSVPVSPDGKVLASVLYDKTIRLWDAQTRAPLGNPLTDHSNWITSIVFSPDGRVLASGSSDKTVRLWDPQTGAPLGSLTGHSSEITSVVFSPDSKVLASGSDDNTVRLWDAQTGAPLGHPLIGHSDKISSVVFSSDGKVLASGSYDKTVQLWDAQTGAPLGHPLTGHSDWIESVVFSPDGKVLASRSRDNTVRLWDVQTGASLDNPLTGHSGSITSIVFSPDGKVLASALCENTVQLWDAQTGASLGNLLTGHSGSIRSVLFSPDGKVLASGSSDKTVRLWDAQSRAPLGNPLTGHSNQIESVVFSPDSKVLASGSRDKTVRLWDAQTGASLVNPLTGHSDRINSVVFSPDGKVLASGSSDKTVRLWDAQTGAPFGNPLTGHSGWINSVVFSPDGKVLASGSADKTVRLWDTQTTAPLDSPLTGHTDLIFSVVISPNGNVLVSRSNDQTVRLWDAQTGSPLGRPLASHSYEIVFSPDSKVLASGSYDKMVRLWDAQTGAQLGDALTGHSKSITSVVFSPDGKVLASGSDDEIRLWDAQTGAPLGHPLTGHSQSIRSFVFSPDSKVLASGSDNEIRLYDVQTRAPFGNPLTGHSSWINSVVFSPDGKVLASGSADKTVRLWDAQTGAPLGNPLTGHTKLIWFVVFSPDSKVLVSGPLGDNTVRFWDAQIGAPLGHLLTGPSESIKCGVFSPDGKVLAVVSDDKTVRLWDTQTRAPLGHPLTGHSRAIHSLVFSPDGKVLTSASCDGTVRFWDPLTLRSLLSDRPFDLLAC